MQEPTAQSCHAAMFLALSSRTIDDAGLLGTKKSGRSRQIYLKAFDLPDIRARSPDTAFKPHNAAILELVPQAVTCSVPIALAGSRRV
jgi:hypothetical protein